MFFHLLPTYVSVLEFNYCKLVASAKPKLCCHAKHNHKEASKVKSSDAEGLEKELLLAEGEKVMLNHNLWTSEGLLNGVQGVVKKIWFDQGSNPHSHLPAVIFVNFDRYSGPETPALEGIDPSWVPICTCTCTMGDQSRKSSDMYSTSSHVSLGYHSLQV